MISAKVSTVAGMALLAAEQIGRVCAAVELSPGYCDVAVRRWSTLTGRKPRLLRGGEDMGEIEVEKA